MSELEQKIRDLINDPRTHFQLSKDLSAFSKLCSSLDVLGDTELALDTYLSGDENASFGEKYLFVYGVLQALFIPKFTVANGSATYRRDLENRLCGTP